MFNHSFRIALVITAGTAAVLTATSCFASVAVMNCTGIITNGGTDRDVFDTSVGPGTPFSATFQMSTGARDLVSFDRNGWSYVDDDPVHNAYVSFGDYILTPDLSTGALNGVDGANDSGGIDMMRWQSYNSVGGGLTQTFLLASFQDNTGTALTAKGLPPVGPGLSDITRWSSAELTFMATNAANGPRRQWYGTINSINTSILPNAVPEPGSLGLLAMAGFPALLAIRSRFGRRA